MAQVRKLRVRSFIVAISGRRYGCSGVGAVVGEAWWIDAVCDNFWERNGWCWWGGYAAMRVDFCLDAKAREEAVSSIWQLCFVSRV